jgi:hypothetical protein
MRAVLALLIALYAAPALAQPYDAAVAAAQDAALAMAEDARRTAAEAQREADVARQRLETEQRIQSYESQQAQRRGAVNSLSAQVPPPPASSPRIAPTRRALQPEGSEAKPDAKP